jgi:tripartite-type tricarboxylate transporter receptor subunit TctC
MPTTRDHREEVRMSRLCLALIAAVAAVHGAFAADAYPSRPISLVNVFGAGSASDTLCRVIAAPFGAALKQPVVVENRPGADGALAATYVARQPADGYTLLMGTNSPLSADPFLLKDLSYDPVKDFVPVSRVGSFTLILVINPSIPANSFKELVAYAKANPGKLSFASGNTSGIVAGETLKRWAGIDLLHVPYKSTPPALEDIIAGRVSMMFADLTTAMPHVNAGALRALAVTRIKRSAVYPELPTLDEEGVTGFDLDAWAGIVAPARTPPEIVDRLNKELRVIIDDPAIRGRLKTVGFEAFSSSPGELGDFVKVQLGKWEKMVKESGVKPR